jgi:tetratricopeptide (TPR) repeat protein
MSDNKFFSLLGIILVVFLGIRIAFLSSLFDTVLVNILVLDSDWYYRWAASLAKGFGHPDGPFWIGPGYPMALAGLFKAAGSTAIKLIPVAQILLSMMTVFFLSMTVRRFLGDLTALVTAGIAALYAPWMYYDGMVLSASWILFLNAALLYLLLTKTDLADNEPREEKTQLAMWGLAGVLCGLSALARPTMLIFAILLIVTVMLMKRLPRRVLKLSLFVLMIIVVHLPVIARNLSVSGSAAFATSSGGINFYIGNRDGASGKYDEAPWLQSADVYREAEGYRKEAEARTGEKMTLNQASTFWAETALREIFQNKIGWLKLMAKKFWMMLRNEEIANNFSLQGTQSFVPWLGKIPLRWGLLLPFAMAGLILLWPKRKNLWVFALYALAYIATNLLFFVSSEYRFPLILLLLPLAAYFLVEIWKYLEEKAWRKISFSVIVYCLVLLIANWPSPDLKKITSAAVDYNNLGSMAALRRMPFEALQFYTRALMIDDSHKGTRIGLADALWSLESYDAAREEYARAGVQPPDSISGSPLDSLFNDLDKRITEGDAAGALAVLESEIPANTRPPLEMLIAKGKLQFLLKQYIPAYETMMQVHERDPESPEWPYFAANYILETGNTFAADSLYKEAIRRFPAFAPARIGRAFLGVETGDVDIARYELSELQKIQIKEDSVAAQVDSLKELLEIIGK